jgi:hypothetical protein
MTKWNQFIDSKTDKIWVGSVFRTQADDPYENVVDFMVIENNQSPSNLSLLVTTGAKAGYILLNFPKEATHSDPNICAISKDWLVNNWTKWVYDKDLKQVLYIANYPPGI